MTNKFTEDMTGTGQYIEMEDEPERYDQWMLWKMRQKEKHKHYMEVLKRHDRERTCWNDRMKYWNNIGKKND